MSATALLVMGSPASAAPAPVCSGGAVNTCTVTFSTPGVGQSWVVPTGVTSESFDLFGATGALTGGDGARVTGTLSLAAGTSVTVDVGGAGSGGTGGANGGGNAFFGGGGGGGASDIQLAGADQLVAGGGGGFGTANQTCGSPASPAGGAGGNADTTGGNGGAVTVPFVVTLTLNGGGGGAGTSAGGVAGPGGTVSPLAPFDLCPPAPSLVSPGGSGAAGTSGQGGGGNGSGGGGGGGGFFGGGQGGGGAFDAANNGGASGGGGGGSSFGITGSNFAVSDTGNDGSVNAGNGQVVITYIVNAATTPTTNPTTSPGPATASTTGGATGTGTKSPVLAVTGLDVLPLLVAGIALIAGGVALVEVTSRRQKRTPQSPWRLH